jgi:hypothetical protein
MRPAQQWAIIRITNKFPLGTRAATCRVQLLQRTMTVSYQHHVRRAGLCFTQSQQRCAVMPLRPVMISVWNKKTGTGNQN